MNNLYDPNNEAELLELRRKKQEERARLEGDTDSPWIGALAGLASWASGKNDAGASIMARRDEPRKARLSALDKELETATGSIHELAKYKRSKLDADSEYQRSRTDKLSDYQMTQKDELAREHRQRAHDLRKLGLEQKGSKKQFESLPMENQEIIKDLSKKNAGQISIANEIDQTVKLFDDPNISEDQKITRGLSLIKTLNSTQGADAVGTEEAKRLGSYLENKMFNFRQPGSMFGRDINEFRDQAAITSNAIKNTVGANQSQVESLKSGRPLAASPLTELNSQKPPGQQGGPARQILSADDMAAMEFVKQNPNTPEANAVMQKLIKEGKVQPKAGAYGYGA